MVRSIAPWAGRAAASPHATITGCPSCSCACAAADRASLMKSIVAAVAGDENDPLRIVAALGAKVFVTANGDPLLEMLLAQCGKPPVPIVTKWRDERESMMREDKRLGNPGQVDDYFGDPAPEKPLLYDLFRMSQLQN